MIGSNIKKVITVKLFSNDCIPLIKLLEKI
jgi:hypothetical protein